MSERTAGPRYYQTRKAASKSVGEILSLLSEFRAESFHVQQKDGQPVAIAFVYRGIGFQLVPSIAGLEARLKKSGTSARVDVEAVAWAQLRNFLELQMEIVESGLMTAETVFGGHAWINGRTVGEMIAERRSELMPGEMLLLVNGSGK